MSIDITPFVQSLQEKTVAVLGIGASGLSVIKALVKAGVKVYGWDDKEDGREKGRKAGAEITELTKDILPLCDCLIVAPGVPLNHPDPHHAVDLARTLGVEIIGDIEIFYRSQPERKIIALTGTNGKSTTATLIAHILNNCGVKTALAGNIGVPVLDVKLPPKGGAVVLELSSFQLDLVSKFTADIGIVINLTLDHIDRHGSMDEYGAIKEKIFSGKGLAAIIGVDDEYCAAMYQRLKESEGRKIIPVSILEELGYGVSAVGGKLVDALDGAPDAEHDMPSLNNIQTLNGAHNKQNAAIAYAAARMMGLEAGAILEAMKSYPGLAHRQFVTRLISGVAYINDSKATNADAAATALACNSNIYWILGGKPKEGGLRGLEMYMERVKHAFLIGQASEDFADWLDKYGVEYTKSGTLDVAVKQAHEMAQGHRGQPGGAGVVLLSPACASYDQFKSFEDRGDQFTAFVNALPEDGG